MGKKLNKIFKWTFRLVVLGLFIAGWALAAAALHVVVVPASDTAPEDGVISASDNWSLIVLPKNRLGFDDTYADTRQWTPADAGEHPTLLHRLVEADKAQYLAHVVEPDTLRKLNQMLDRRSETLASVPRN